MWAGSEGGKEGLTDKAGHRCGCAGWWAWHDAGCLSADAAYRRDRGEVQNLLSNWPSSTKTPPKSLSSALVRPEMVPDRQIHQVARLRSLHFFVPGASCAVIDTNNVMSLGKESNGGRNVKSWFFSRQFCQFRTLHKSLVTFYLQNSFLFESICNTWTYTKPVSTLSMSQIIKVVTYSSFWMKAKALMAKQQEHHCTSSLLWHVTAHWLFREYINEVVFDRKWQPL